MQFSRNTGSRSLKHHILLYAQYVINPPDFTAENNEDHRNIKTIIQADNIIFLFILKLTYLTSTTIMSNIISS